MDNLNNEIQKQYERMGINSDVLNISDEIINDLSQRFQKIDKIAEDMLEPWPLLRLKLNFLN